jgi:hypothetical protein
VVRVSLDPRLRGDTPKALEDNVPACPGAGCCGCPRMAPRTRANQADACLDYRLKDGGSYETLR